MKKFFIAGLIAAILTTLSFSLLSLKGENLQGYLAPYLNKNVANITIDPNKIPKLKNAETCNNGEDDNNNKLADCLDLQCGETSFCKIEIGKKLCLLNDEKQNSIFIDSFNNNLQGLAYSRKYVVKDENTCELITAEFYNKIAPSFKAGNYSVYNKSNNKINLICEPCEINQDLLDWRFNKLTELYDRTTKALGIPKLWPQAIKYYISQNNPGDKKGGDFYVNSGGKGAVYIEEAKNFIIWTNKLSNNEVKKLHKDYADKAYKDTFEKENIPIHEMIHVAFDQYGDFSYYIEESFTQILGAMLGGKGQNKNDTAGDIKPDSFCYDQFKYIGYPLLNYLCTQNNFDIDDVPTFFTNLSQLRIQSGKDLHDTDLIQAMNMTVGVDTSALFNQFK